MQSAGYGSVADFSRADAEFTSHGAVLRGWLYHPEGTGRRLRDLLPDADSIDDLETRVEDLTALLTSAGER